MMPRARTEVSTAVRIVLFFAALVGGGWCADCAVLHCPALLLILGTAAMAAVFFAVLLGFYFSSRG
jgi:hypothetical protein